ncbi:DUF2254 domain-containing protein [Mycobacterium sp. E3198]|uniref:DUF2254 domain-containing protein n=1 Tax=Mycobacterium sp. E3198 TaxID=1834143 RepID=UPI00080234CA|nr:DUF2254 domain-containing protein [Mycobacterium sp. E3198]OBG35980.1 hypothetical protein A5673_18865 [Mycobacterium sp. E3198]
MPSATWRSRVSDALLTRLWPVPLIGVVVAIGAGLGVPALDRAIDDTLPDLRIISGSTVDDARELLGTITTAMMTVTSLTFSLTVVTLQLASGQYSPRLLRTFARDRFVQTTMALFLATFAYALTVLQNVQNGPSQTVYTVPHLATAVAALLALLSVVGLVFFLAHLVGEIRVETMMHTVCADAIAAGTDVFQARDPTGEPEAVPQPPPDAALVRARSTGFLVSVDAGPLASAAEQAGAVVFIIRTPGDWLIAGEPLGYVWLSDSPDPPGAKVLERLNGRVTACVHTGNERTPVQDVGYGLRQLTDVAVKALSPGVNDPTTAVHALGYSSALLCCLVQRRLSYKTLRCGDATRVVVRLPSFAELLDMAVAQPRRYGADDPTVLARLLTLLREVAWQTTQPEHRSAIAGQLARVRRTAAGQNFDEVELAGLADLGRDVEAVLAGDWRPSVNGGR